MYKDGGTKTPARIEQKAVGLVAALIYRFTPSHSDSQQTLVMDFTCGTGTNTAFSCVELIITMYALLGTTAIAGLHVPGTKVICIEKDEEMFNIAKKRVENFEENKKNILEEAYPIFAKCKLIPSNGSMAAAGELSKDEESDSVGNGDGSSEEESVMADEEVNILDLLECRLKLRPPPSHHYANGFVESINGAWIEATALGNIEIRKSRIKDGGNGVFAKQHIEKGQVLLHYWGDVYVVAEGTGEELVSSLDTHRMVQTRKFIMKGSEKKM